MTGSAATRLLAAAAGIILLVWVVVFVKDLLDPYHLPLTEWWAYKSRFVASDGRVVDNGNGNISHSEGQAYGMLLAEAYGDRWTFDRIWGWTKHNLQVRTGDKLLAWLWKPGPGPGGGAVADMNNASDAEILTAWALLRAAKRWGDYKYKQQAAEMLVDLRRLAVKDTALGSVLIPGLEGFVKPDGVVLNPSYYVFPALDTISKVFPGSGWDTLEAGGLRLVHGARFGKWQLTPDWVLSGRDYSLNTQFPPDFGYNAVRIPLHLAWSDPKSGLLAPFADFWSSFANQDSIPATVDLANDALGKDPALPGMLAIARLTIACRKGEKLTVKNISPLTSEEPYFSASLKLLAKVAVRDVFGGRP